MKTIEILINPDGQLTINAVGFQGSNCEQATAFLEEALGKLATRQLKRERFRLNVRWPKQKVGA